MQQSSILIDFCLRKTSGTIRKPDLLSSFVHTKDDTNKKALSRSYKHQPDYLTNSYLYDTI